MPDQQYSDELALRLAEHARAVYAAPDDYWRWALGRGFEGAVIAAAGSTQVGIAYSPGEIIVAARGSSQLGDWGENVLSLPFRWPSVFPCGRVHLGFRIQAARIRRKFESAFAAASRLCPSARVYVTGHSLGGALSIFLARLLSLSGRTAEAVYTFESPRVGTKRFSEWYAEIYGQKTFRVVMVRRGVADIVTRVPPSSWGWQHVGRPIIIRDGWRYESEDAWQAARARHPVRPLAQWRVLGGLLQSVRAHLADDMVKDLEAVLARNGAGK